MKKTIVFTIILFVLATNVFAQTKSESWIWKERAVKDKPQTQFTISFQRRGNKVTGTYSVDTFLNGEWQGEDGNQTPFIGTVKNGVIQVEFDPFATVPGYQQNVRYKKPGDGRSPSKAKITIQGKILSWTITGGEKIEGLGDSLRLTRDVARKR